MLDHVAIFAGVAAIILVNFIFVLIYASRYARVGPNQALIVYGRKVRTLDGRTAGFRIVRSGGTFVFPVIEQAKVLSLEIFSLELSRYRAPATGASLVTVDFAAQLKIKSDDASLMTAIECFVGKSPAEIQSVTRPILENHLKRVLGQTPQEDILQRPADCAARLQASVTPDLAKLGLDLISCTLTNPRPA